MVPTYLNITICFQNTIQYTNKARSSNKRTAGNITLCYLAIGLLQSFSHEDKLLFLVPDEIKTAT